MKKINVIRHGDLTLVPCKKPAGLGKKEMPFVAQEVMRGSQGKPHLVKNGIVYLKKVNDFVFGYLEAKRDCVLLHEDHGAKVKGQKLREAPLKAGWYALRNQVEKTHEGMKIVID